MARNQKQFEQEDEEMSEESPVNVLDMLKEDHQKVKQLFEEFDNAEGKARQGIVEEALKELEIHSKIEEALVYPAIREAIEEEETVDEANEEHHVVKLLIKELRKMKGSAEGYRPKFKVLSELVKHHIEEEENEMFPQAEQADMEWEEISREAMKIKDRMMKQKSSSSRRAA